MCAHALCKGVLGVQFWFYFVTSSLSSKAQSLVMVEAEGRRRVRKKLPWSPLFHTVFSLPWRCLGIITEWELSGKFLTRMMPPQLLLLAPPSHQHLAVQLQHFSADILSSQVSYVFTLTSSFSSMRIYLQMKLTSTNMVTLQMQLLDTRPDRFGSNGSPLKL